MARAAGSFSASGIAATAAAVWSVYQDQARQYGHASYDAAAGRMMIAQDLIWDDDERAAIREAFDEIRAKEIDNA